MDTDATRIAHIEQLARQVFTDPRWGKITVDVDHGGVDVLSECGGLLLGVQAHEHALVGIQVALTEMLRRMQLDELRKRQGAAPVERGEGEG